MRTWFARFLVIVLSPILAIKANDAPDNDWSYQWHAVVAPDKQDAFWSKRGNGKNEITENGFLIETKGEEGMLFAITMEGSSGVWDGRAPMIIEFSAQSLHIEDGKEAAAHLVVSDGQRCAAVSIKQDTKDLYRLEWIGGTGRLWVNEIEAPELIIHLPVTEGDPFANSLYFGDESSLSAGGSVWHYIRWKPLTP